MPRELTYYVGASVDGFIAGPGGAVDAFVVGQDVIDFIVAEVPETLPTHVRSALGVDAPNRRFDAVVQGRGTYAAAFDVGITSPYAHLEQHVVSRSLGPSPDPAVTVVPDDPVAAVRELKARDGLGVWLAGGGDLAGQLADEVDELVVKLYPTVLGAGTPMFGGRAAPAALELRSARTLAGGAVVLTYRRTREAGA